ncbi:MULTISPECIES: hypothetical protein [Chroococcidiopsis]|uniref:hypothetical protein n=1 Tax=Chroococcidiopsis TaxID=54298 RepID=UPI0015E7DF13|nr:MULTISPECIES: hypothetical protein [Chroococcidiopsis]URD48327.1 hypothetical protein M5J74_18505 [Chroococcidiopsis sp. CCNUC1]
MKFCIDFKSLTQIVLTPILSYQPSVIGDRLSVTSFQVPPNYQLPTTNYQLPLFPQL